MSDVSIHPTAIVSPRAKLGKGVSIGPFCVIGSEVSIGAESVLHSHVVIDGHVEIGKKNEFFPFGSIGAPPQDIFYKGEATRVVIGEENIFREYVSIHRGTTKEKWVTSIGSKSFFMSGVHLAHDVTVGSNCIFASNVILGGHVKIERNVFVGGGSCFKPFVRVGRGVYIGGGSVADRDLPAFCTGYGNRFLLSGPNIVGLRKLGFSREEISLVVKFYKEMKSEESSSYNFAKKLLESGKVKSNLVNEICQSIIVGKCGVPLFRKLQ